MNGRRAFFPRPTRFTPLHLSLLLHYHCYCEDWPQLYAPAVQEYLGHLVAEGLLKKKSVFNKSYQTTEKGYAHIEALCQLQPNLCKQKRDKRTSS